MATETNAAAAWAWQVCDIGKAVCRELVCGHHYSGSIPGIKRAWGLYENGALIGAIVFSIPASFTLCRGVCGASFSDKVIELSRLVIVDRQKNAASFLIGAGLRLLAAEGNWIVVSYADGNSEVGHVGYVYQATNWLYTGLGNAEPAWVDPTTGNVISYTRRHIDTKAGRLGLDWRQLVQVPRVGKHRYVTFIGSRCFKAEARGALNYGVLPYPKGPSTRHSSIALQVGVGP